MNKKLFAVIAGERLAGKTTLAGTLPGSTLLLQAAVKESSSASALRLASRRGNKLKVETFTDLQDLRAKMEKEAKSKEYDHIYIDGFSAINNLRFNEHDIQTMAKKNIWDAYGKHGGDMDTLLEWLKMFTYEPFAKNVFLTCALKLEAEGGVVDVKLECKGKMAVTSITKLGEAVLIPMLVPAGEGGAGTRRVMLTKSYEKYPARIDGLLDDENPGYLDCDLSLVLNLLNSTTEQGVAA